MTEVLIQPGEQPAEMAGPQREQAVADCEAFIGDMAPHLGKIFGIPYFDISVGKGWATQLDSEKPKVTADPRFFLDKGYTPEMSGYAITHEIAAHLREVVFSPALTREVKQFISPKHGDSQARSIFHNIFSDIAGNNLTHVVLPHMAGVAEELYSQKLFPETDYSESKPRHLQFLYKVIRQEMIPGSETKVLPEVDDLIDELRNFQGKGDLIKYSTQIAKSAREAMPAEQRFHIWRDNIYPLWKPLIEMDKDDPKWQKKKSDGDGQSQDGQSGTSEPDFSESYQDYNEERHPEPMSDEEHQAIHKAVEAKKRDDKHKEKQAKREASPEYKLDKKLREETGHTLADQRRYQAEVLKWREQITDMRDVFSSVIQERVAAKRALRGTHTEGALLNPDRLAQTYVDIQTGSHEPAAFHAYEQVAAERELVGKTDYIFVFDRSGSMGQLVEGQKKSQAAASSLVICLEGLDGMQRDIKQAEFEAGVTLDLDIRTGLYTFNDEVSEPKVLGHGLTTKQRLDAYGEVCTPGGGNADSTVLDMIEKLEVESDRRHILIMVADGEADSPTAARASVERLRGKGWQVYGVSIGSDAAVELYAPTSRRVDDPAILPSVMKQLIQETI